MAVFEKISALLIALIFLFPGRYKIFSFLSFKQHSLLFAGAVVKQGMGHYLGCRPFIEFAFGGIMRAIIILTISICLHVFLFGNYSFAGENHKSLLIYTRLGVDESGESFFKDESVELNTWPSGMAMISLEEQSDTVRFFKAKPGWQMLELHYAPKRQYLIVLQGVLEIHTSTGHQRKFPQGSILLVEDTYGKGHRTRNVGENDLILVWVGLKE